MTLWALLQFYASKSYSSIAVASEKHTYLKKYCNLIGNSGAAKYHFYQPDSEDT